MERKERKDGEEKYQGERKGELETEKSERVVQKIISFPHKAS